MNQIPVDQSVLRFEAVKVYAKAYKGVQSVDTDGTTPLWHMQVLVSSPFEYQATLLQISVPSKSSPVVPPLAEIQFKELVARLWSKNGNSGISYRAQGFKIVGAI